MFFHNYFKHMISPKIYCKKIAYQEQNLNPYFDFIIPFISFSSQLIDLKSKILFNFLTLKNFKLIASSIAYE